MGHKPPKDKKKALPLWRVFTEQSPPGYFQVAYVTAKTPERAIGMVREVVGQPFVNADGTFGPLYPDTANGILNAAEVETSADLIHIGWTVPQ